MTLVEYLGIRAHIGGILSKDIGVPGTKTYFVFLMRERMGALRATMLSMAVGFEIGGYLFEHNIMEVQPGWRIVVFFMLVLSPLIVTMPYIRPGGAAVPRLILYDGGNFYEARFPFNNLGFIDHVDINFAAPRRYRRCWMPVDKWRFDRIIKGIEIG